MIVATLLWAMLPVGGLALYDFTPDKSPSVYDLTLPTQYSLSETQLGTSFLQSYWFTHYLTTADNIEFILVSHAMVFSSNTFVTRTSLLEPGNPENYSQYTQILPRGNATSSDSRLSILAPGFELSSSSDDNLASMVSKGSTDSYQYNITVLATSKVLLNAGTGAFTWGASNATQWSLPSCQTSGTLIIGDTLHEIDEERSMTWYDRQYGDGAIDSEFTWFGIHFPGSDIKASIWYSDNEVPEQHLRFATVRTDHGLSVIRFNMTSDPADSWTSPNSNYTYQTKWSINFDNGDFLEIESVRDDQEIYAEGSIYVTTAFVTAKGKFFGQTEGFGLTDITPPLDL